MSVSYVARRAGVAPSLLFNWRRRMLEGALQAVQADEDVVGTSGVRGLERRVRELERLLGRKTNGSRDSQGSPRRRAGKKTELAAAIMERLQGRFAMKAVADTLAVARSNLIERVSRRAESRRPQGRGRRAIGADPPAGGRAPNLRVSAYPAPHKPSAKGQRKAASQWQACAADHAGQQTDARTAYRPPARAHA